MRKIWRRLRMVHRIALCVLLPLLSLGALSAQMAIDRSHFATRMSALHELVQLAVDASSLAHELQKERGRSNAFLNGGDTEQELDAQRALTDQRMNDLYIRIMESGRLLLGPVGTAVEAVQVSLGRLGDVRDGVTAKRASPRLALDFYTSLINNITVVVGNVVDIGTDIEVARPLSAYLAVVQGKEQAALERGTAVGGIAAGKFAPREYQNFMSTHAKQAVYINAYLRISPDALKKEMNELLAAAITREVDRQRNIILSGGLNGELQGLTPQEWFSATTERVNRLRKVEELTAAASLTAVQIARDAAQRSFYASILVTGSLGLVTVLVTIFVARGVTKPLAEMVGVMERLARGERAVIPALDRGDEVGDIARALGTIYAHGVAAQRIKAALDTAHACVLVVDPAAGIIYANPAVVDMFARAEAAIAAVIDGFTAGGLEGMALERLLGPCGQAESPALAEGFERRVVLGGRSFAVCATAVLSRDGERLGTVIEWQDLTDELAMQEEVDAIVRAGLEGDLNQRIALDGKAGFMLRLSEGVNLLLQTVGEALVDTAGMFESLSHGDLTRRVSAQRAGVFGQLAADANRTADRLTEIVGHIAAAAETVRSAASEITAGTSDLSRRTERQAANLEQTATAMEEMVATVRRNADHASEADGIASTARKRGEQGGVVAGEAVEAIGRIRQWFDRISDITAVIDEIAFQTHLLALNAAVEAARAGSSGAGFAVVATEVRNLASRSREASREIKQLIVTSSGEVRQGVSLVERAGQALESIVANVSSLADLVSSIATASAQQASGLDQICVAIAEMDDMTGKNSSLVEESLAAASSLEREAVELNEQMAFFKTSHRVLRHNNKYKRLS